MPEGPSIVIVKEAAQIFKGKKVLSATGNTRIDKNLLIGQKLVDIRSWGKHLLICFPKFTLRVHFMLFGSYRINEKREVTPRLRLEFKNGNFDFYASAIRILEEPLDSIYDWSADVMNDDWKPARARKKLKALPETLVCDALLDQQIFAGVGNIIKNEVLYRIFLHPKSKLGALPTKQMSLLIKEARNYSFDFLEWKKKFVLKKHWLAHTKRKCVRCEIPLHKEYLGKTRRRTFFCNNCQVLFE